MSQALILPFTLPTRARRLKERLQSLEAQAALAAARLDELGATCGGLGDRVGGLEVRAADATQSLGSLGDDVAKCADQLADVHRELDRRHGRDDQRMLQSEQRLDAVEAAVRTRESELSARLDGLRARGDALIERLAEELAELGSLVERMLRREPLPAPALTEEDAVALAEALEAVQPLLLESFRGSEEEISHRLAHHLCRLRDAAPVLDLGAGRGELLLLLREAGLAATGVEADPALAAACRRRGLSVIEGHVLAVLRDQEEGSWGAVTAIHLFEHLPPAVLLQTAAEIRRVLRPGGVLVAECPNPHTLRVGSSLYWLDPTHQRPLPPETLQLCLRTSGFTDLALELLHPFPEQQCLAADALPLPADAAPGVAEVHEQLRRLQSRLDELINGPRDFVITASKPQRAENASETP